MNTETLLLWIIAAGLVLAFVVPYWWRHRRRERTVRAELERIQAAGGVEPASLHPEVNPSICIGTGNCVKVCPEKDVLGLLHGQAVTVNPTHCVGHGLCERSCPVEAIQLVLGTAKRGVDIPRIQENFETNVDGIYVVGELGGMGLIRNAFEQARQCVEGITTEKRRTPSGALDALIVGCGPAGLAASLNCLHHGLDFRTLEKEDIGGTVRYYPRKKLVMTYPLKVPGYGTLDFKHIQKEDLIETWHDIIDTTGVDAHIQTGTPFPGAEPGDDCFVVETPGETIKTRRLILAIGRRGTPRKLGIPGEEAPNVAYALLEPEQFAGNRVTVVGGGDSAVEAALALAGQPGTTVRLSYRKDKFNRLKPLNQERIEEAVMGGRVEFLRATNLTEITRETVTYEDAGGTAHTIPNDYVFVFIGGVLPTGMLKDLGVQIDTKFGEPLMLR
ncbi:MAG: NAD(P)-binding domain-containing protein [Rhodothermales bacterium]|nr:NAD(P)-binding domain-containing protein [Rhodothermales bacterium]